jgi:hypothetical protein
MSWLQPVHRSLASIDLPNPTGWGAKLCKRWPHFALQDYNADSGKDYLQFYGLDDIHEMKKSDVTILGLYFSDLASCQESVIFHEKLKTDIEKKHKKLKVTVVAINFWAPYSCATLECTETQTTWTWTPWVDNCVNYIGGCPPGAHSANSSIIMTN